MFLPFGSGTFLTELLKAFASLETVYLSVEKKEPYEKTGMLLVEDEYKEIGPLGGLYSSLHFAKEEALLVVACDMPFVDQRVVLQLSEAWEKYHTSIVAVAEEKVQPLLAVYEKKTLPVIKEQIENENYKMMELLNRIDYKTVVLRDSHRAVQNINSKKDYIRLIRNDGKGNGK